MIVTRLLTCTALLSTLYVLDYRGYAMLDSPTGRTDSPRFLPPEDNRNNAGLREQTEQALNASGQPQLASDLSSLPRELAHGQQHALCCPACSASVCAQHALCALTN